MAKNELTLWELLECVKGNLNNYLKTYAPQFFTMALEQLDMAIKQAEVDEKDNG